MESSPPLSLEFMMFVFSYAIHNQMLTISLQLKVYYKDELAARPLKIKVHPDLSNVIFSGIEPCSVGSLVEVVVSNLPFILFAIH